MAKYLIDGTTLTAIADAIREKTGGTGDIFTEDMASEIYSIEVGGSGENKLVQMFNKSVTEITEKDLEGATQIGIKAFENCKQLQSVALPSGLLNIGEMAFYGCSLIKKITIPTSVKILSKGAFYYCSALEIVEFEDGIQLQTLGNEVFNQSGIKSISFPSGISSVPMYTCSGCTKLETVEIPSSVTAIGSRAFQICSALKSVTIKATTPPTLNSDSFYACTALEKIIVPAGCGDVYKAATNWSTYASIIVEEGGSVNTKLPTPSFLYDIGDTWVISGTGAATQATLYIDAEEPIPFLTVDIDPDFGSITLQHEDINNALLEYGFTAGDTVRLWVHTSAEGYTDSEWVEASDQFTVTAGASGSTKTYIVQNLYIGVTDTKYFTAAVDIPTDDNVYVEIDGAVETAEYWYDEEEGYDYWNFDSLFLFWEPGMGYCACGNVDYAITVSVFTYD